MKKYNYDRETKEFLFSEDARLDPLETKRIGKPIYLQSLFSTFIEPPENLPNKRQVFVNDKWEYIDDFRGKKVYDINTGYVKYITALGISQLENTVDQEPPNEYLKPVFEDNKWVEKYKEEKPKKTLLDLLATVTTFEEFIIEREKLLKEEGK